MKLSGFTGLVLVYCMCGCAGIKAQTWSLALTDSAQVVARVTGSPSENEQLPDPNKTFKNYVIETTDLGIMWETNRQEIMMAFGDNFGKGLTFWKSNALAISGDKEPADGISFSSMVMNKDSVQELIVAGKKKGQTEGQAGYEHTCIPTAGVCIGNRQFINFMSIHKWQLGGDNDQWLINFSEIAYSDDYGKTWTRSGTQWRGDGKFAQTSYLKKDGYLYMFGTPAGRYGNIFLSRVEEDKILDKASYSYWNGSDWLKGNENLAEPVAYGATGEMSVCYNEKENKFLLTYLSVTRRAIVYREADQVTGDWSGEKVLVEDKGNAVYAPAFHPWFSSGKELYFAVSHAHPIWNIFLYRANFVSVKGKADLIAEGGFEDFPVEKLSYRSQWKFNPGATATADAHSGKIACQFKGTASSAADTIIAQKIAVQPQHKYILTGWVKSNLNDRDFTIGVKGDKAQDEMYMKQKAGMNWTKFEQLIEAGINNVMDIFFTGGNSAGFTIILDDIELKSF
ncbi:MAG: DUF4185 domain-containing protein [Ferruginibacter sp.]